MRNGCFGAKCTVSGYRTSDKLFRGTELARKFFARTHPMTSIRPETTFGYVLENSATFCWQKDVKSVCFGTRMHWFGIASFGRSFSLWTHPIYDIRPKMMFGSDMGYMGSDCMKIDAKRLFRGRMHYFGVPNFRRTFSREHTQ